MRRHQRLELSDELRVKSERELGVDPVLERCQSQPLQARDLRLGEPRVSEVGQGWAAPEGESLSKGLGGGLARARGQLLSTFSEQPLEAAGVDSVGIDAQAVAGGPSGDRGLLSEGPPEVGDVNLEGVARAFRLAVGPELLGQP